MALAPPSSIDVRAGLARGELLVRAPKAVGNTLAMIPKAKHPCYFSTITVTSEDQRTEKGHVLVRAQQLPWPQSESRETLFTFNQFKDAEDVRLAIEAALVNDLETSEIETNLDGYSPPSSLFYVFMYFLTFIFMCALIVFITLHVSNPPAIPSTSQLALPTPPIPSMSTSPAQDAHRPAPEVQQEPESTEIASTPGDAFIQAAKGDL